MARELLTTTEAAELLGISRTSVHRLIQSGEIPALTIPRMRVRRVSRRWLEGYVERLSDAAEEELRERKAALEEERAALDRVLGIRRTG